MALKVMFCTIVSKFRLHQCVAMYHSLRCFMDAALYVLAVDETAKRILEAMKLPGMIVIALSQLEDSELREIKQKRDISEYCWTLKPVLLLHLYENHKDFGVFAYLDSDLFFFSDPMKLFKKGGNWSVLLTTHKVDRKANGGFVAFMRGIQAHAALKWWKERCLEWCYCHKDSGRFADQGYLDFMRTRFIGVLYLDSPGANLATWNYFNYDLSLKDGNILVNGCRLIFYHFSSLRVKRNGGSITLYGAEMPRLVYESYSKALSAAITEIEGIDQKAAEYFYSGV